MLAWYFVKDINTDNITVDYRGSQLVTKNVDVRGRAPARLQLQRRVSYVDIGTGAAVHVHVMRECTGLDVHMRVHAQRSTVVNKQLLACLCTPLSLYKMNLLKSDLSSSGSSFLRTKALSMTTLAVDSPAPAEHHHHEQG